MTNSKYLIHVYNFPQLHVAKEDIIWTSVHCFVVRTVWYLTTLIRTTIFGIPLVILTDVIVGERWLRKVMAAAPARFIQGKKTCYSTVAQNSKRLRTISTDEVVQGVINKVNFPNPSAHKHIYVRFFSITPSGVKYLTKVINLSLTTLHIFNMWKIGRINPLLKPGKPVKLGETYRLTRNLHAPSEPAD